MRRILPEAKAALTLICTVAIAANGAAWADGREVPLSDGAELAYQETLTLELPAPDEPASEHVFLSFGARIEARFKSGSATALQVCVNGLPTSVERLRNKPGYYLYSSEQRVPWYSPGLAAWVVTYYPWERLDVADGQAHAYVLDIADLLRPTGNTLTFESTYDAVPDAVVQLQDVRLLLHDTFAKSPALGEEQGVTESRGLARFRKLALGYHSGAEATLNTEIAYRPEVGVVAPREGYGQDYELAVDERGRIFVTVGGDRYDAYSWLRTPASGWMTVGQNGERGWQSLRVEGETIICETTDLALQRSVLRRDSHVVIRDRVTNRTDADLPVVLLNALDVGEVSGLIEFRVSGQLQSRFWASTSPTEGRRTAATPTAYVERENSAGGLVMEDDAWRNQGSVLVWDSTLAIGDDMFYLAPGAEHTFVWKIFPLAEPGYYGLVNALRHDWGLFGHIPGLLGFVHPSSQERMYEDVRLEGPAEIAEWLGDTGIDVAATTAVMPFEDGRAGTLYGNEELDLLRTGIEPFVAWREAVREHGAEPDCLPYMDVHLCRLVGERTLDDLETRLPGCLIRAAWGGPVAYRTGWLYNVLPTLDNPCGRHLFDVLRLFMDELEFGGIYLDEWDHSRARVSFSHEDGMSALLDDEGRIVRKVGIVPIMARDFQVAFIEELVERDAVIFANQFDATLTPAQLPVVHFAEPFGSYDNYLLAAAQCCRTPLALHVKATRGIWQDAREFLKRGLLMCYYWKYLHGDHVLKRCFPITVRELWPGVVIGDDRIVTCASGTFTLGRDLPLTAYVYAGPEGTLQAEVAANASVEGHVAVELALTDYQIAVIMEE